MAADRLLIFTDALPRRRARAAHYESCLRETIAAAARERGRVEVWHARSRPMSRWLEENFPHLVVRQQTTGGPGRRVPDAFARSFADGAERIVALLRPSPTVPESTLTSAFHDLHETDAVLGPAAGGGCYLVGLRDTGWQRAPDVFTGVPWSDPAEWDTLLRSATDAGLGPRVLPGLAGIETDAAMVKNSELTH